MCFVVTCWERADLLALVCGVFCEFGILGQVWYLIVSIPDLCNLTYFAANPSNPAHEITFPPNYVDLYEQKPKAIKSFGVRISPLLESANIKPHNIEKHFTPNIPAWCLKPPEILFDLHSGKKSESNPHILKDNFRKMQSRNKNYQQIYNDGSKEDSKVGCAVISDNHSNMQRIPDDSSIFTAEAKAIDLALDFINTCDANNKFILFSDSLSVLKAMNHTSSKNPQIQKLLEKMS